MDLSKENTLIFNKMMLLFLNDDDITSFIRNVILLKPNDTLQTQLIKVLHQERKWDVVLRNNYINICKCEQVERECQCKNYVLHKQCNIRILPEIEENYFTVLAQMTQLISDDQIYRRKCLIQQCAEHGIRFDNNDRIINWNELHPAQQETYYLLRDTLNGTFKNETLVDQTTVDVISPYYVLLVNTFNADTIDRATFVDIFQKKNIMVVFVDDFKVESF
jgi:hypothetical protein